MFCNCVTVLQSYSLIIKKEDFEIETRFGSFRLRAYEQTTNKQIHIALTKGSWNSEEHILTRINSTQVNNDLLGTLTNNVEQQLDDVFKIINKQKPDIVFLDIEMPNENGFALFDYFDVPPFETIFCTAYSEYALQAFEVSAIDYILKPISISKVQAAVEKAIKTRGQNKIIEQVSVLKENLSVQQLQKITQVNMM